MCEWEEHNDYGDGGKWEDAIKPPSDSQLLAFPDFYRKKITPDCEEVNK